MLEQFQPLIIGIIGSAIPIAVLAVYIRVTMPRLIQTVLDDVGTQLQQIFAEPNVKKAFSILGKQSGEVRADAALRNRVVEKAMENFPVINKALEYFDITPVEGLQLMNDPLVGPLIQGFLAKAQGGLQGIFQQGQQEGLNIRNRITAQEPGVC